MNELFIGAVLVFFMVLNFLQMRQMNYQANRYFDHQTTSYDRYERMALRVRDVQLIQEQADARMAKPAWQRDPTLEADPLDLYEQRLHTSSVDDVEGAP